MDNVQPQKTPRKKKKGPNVEKPEQPPSGPRVDPTDPVEEASNESFPASDPPSFSSSRSRPPFKGVDTDEDRRKRERGSPQKR